MNYEDYYGAENYNKLKSTEKLLVKLLGDISLSLQEGEIKPIVYITSRIKTPESMMKKLPARGFPPGATSAMTNVYDAVGVRAVCGFADDVYRVAEKIKACEKITTVLEKDYFANPKSNGYRSLHIIVSVDGVYAELQIRTIAMDCWATLEHQLRYKKQIKNEKLILDELKRCADEIASVDLSMQTIKDIISKQGM